MSNNNCFFLTFTPTLPFPASTSIGSGCSPTITWVAMATKSWSSVLEMNGKDLDTRTLHSITFSWLSWKQITIIVNYKVTFLHVVNYSPVNGNPQGGRGERVPREAGGEAHKGGRGAIIQGDSDRGLSD